ncbi:hypothetical protein UFOVP1106_46 [uncultured Caudovirales phage]|uniref:Uncharacterized protein n=1 Tax=uncultured Caudovirales phage TaxID=2100421 RepID=A0A6J5QRQ0_9CAUD|nr:hypothetical protein UFOVP1106_46 [uncultured Caudovirales phage]
MIPLITKQQIGKYVSLSENINDIDVDSFILDAQEFDTINVFPIALLDAIALQVRSNIAQWNKNDTYVLGDKVLFATYYNSLSTNINSEPPSADWADYELMNFYLQYLQPFIAYSFYYRFIAYFGARVTPSGLKEIVDETMQIVSDKRRAEMLGDIKSKVNVWSGRVAKKLSDVNYTFDGVKYTPEDCKRIKQGVRIYALGGHSPKKCFNDFNRYE